MSSDLFLGIDIGGSGIKGALVDLNVGDFASERVRIPTPKKSTPEKVAAVAARIVKNFECELSGAPIGITVPAVVTHGNTRSAANIDKTWINADAKRIFEDVIERPVFLVNDADAAGVAEVKYGAAKGHPGLVLVTTLGTGIGSALINRGVLVPNTELGHLELDGHDAESQASAGVKTDLDLSYSEWIPLLQRYYSHVEALFWPDLFVVGGGISKNANRFLPKLKLKTPIVPATLKNRAGIIGVAWLADDSIKNPTAEVVPEDYSIEY